MAARSGTSTAESNRRERAPRLRSLSDPRGRPLLLIRVEAEECTQRRRRTARADRRQAVGGGVRRRRIVRVRQPQGGVIERRALKADALVGERQQERDERLLLRIAETERTDLRIGLVVGEVAAAIVEVDHLTERRLSAVVIVGPEQLDIAERR